MAQSNDTSKTGTSKPKRRTRRKPQPVTIDLEATEVSQEETEPPKNYSNETAGDKEELVEPGATQSDSPKKPDDTQQGIGSATGSQNPFSISLTSILHIVPYGIAAGIGGLVSLLVYFGLAGLGWLPGTAGPQTERMNSEIVLLRGNIQNLSSDLETLTGETLSGARSRLTDLEAGSAKIGDVALLENLVEGLSIDLQQHREVQNANTENLSSLGERVNSAETALSLASGIVEDFRQQIAEFDFTQRNQAEASALEGLTSRIAALEAILEELGDAANAASPTSALQIAAFRSELDAVRDAANAAQLRLQEKVTDLETQTLKLQTSSRATETGIAELSRAATERLQAMDNALTGLEIRRQAGPVSQMERRAAMALSFASLGRAVDTGKGFKIELDTARAFAGDRPELAILSLHAETGIETLQSLTDRFDQVATIVIRAEKNSQSDSFLDQTWIRLQAIIQIRPTGFVEGEATPAIVARAENLLQSGQLAGAIREMETLPDSTRSAASEWLDRARARKDSDEALASLNADLIAEIEASPETGNPETETRDQDQ